MVGLFYGSDVFEPRDRMELSWQECHRLNVILLSIVGLWPYGNKFVLHLKRFVAGFFTVGCCFCQLATFFTVKYTTKLLMNNAPIIIIGCAVLLKFFSVLAASDSIKRVTETINDDFKFLVNKDEIRIVKKYVDRGRLHTKGFALFVWPAAIFLLLSPLYSFFLDLVLPLDEPRNRTFPVTFELFFDQQKHFFVAALMYDCFTLMGPLVFVSTEGLFFVYIQHACALFEVTSRRIRNLACVPERRGSKEDSNMVVMGQVVEIHSRALRHCKTIRQDFLPPYIILIVLGILGLAGHLLRCAQTLKTHEYTEFFTSVMGSVAILVYMFHTNIMLQTVLNLSADLFNDLYNTEWYASPLSTRKFILFCMLYTIKPVQISIYGLFYPSNEGFFQLARIGVSYATALYSLQ